MKRISLILLLALATTQAFSQKNKTAPSSDKPFVLGSIRELKSTVLGETRTLNIYLPEGYNADDTTHYPVIYLLDGSADEDFIHVVGLVQFNSFPWINRVPRSIVVGIANVDRRRDYTFPTTIEADRKNFPTAGHSEKFMNFIETELQPFINKSYRTSGANTLIGESLGGLLATEILFKRPALFTTYIIVSPSLWWNNASLLKATPAISETVPAQATRVYIGVGKEGLAPGDRVMEVDANLLAEKLQQLKSKQLNVYFDYLPAENHATIGHQALLNAFRWMAPAAQDH